MGRYAVVQPKLQKASTSLQNSLWIPTPVNVLERKNAQLRSKMTSLNATQAEALSGRQKNGSTSLKTWYPRGCVQTVIPLASDFHAGKTINVNEADMEEKGCWPRSKRSQKAVSVQREQKAVIVNASNFIHFTANRFQA